MVGAVQPHLQPHARRGISFAMLVDQLRTHAMVIGYDHRFGRNRGAISVSCVSSAMPMISGGGDPRPGDRPPEGEQHQGARGPLKGEVGWRTTCWATRLQRPAWKVKTSVGRTSVTRRRTSVASTPSSRSPAAGVRGERDARKDGVFKGHDEHRHAGPPWWRTMRAPSK